MGVHWHAEAGRAQISLPDSGFGWDFKGFQHWIFQDNGPLLPKGFCCSGAGHVPAVWFCVCVCVRGGLKVPTGHSRAMVTGVTVGWTSFPGLVRDGTREPRVLPLQEQL